MMANPQSANSAVQPVPGQLNLSSLALAQVLLAKCPSNIQQHNPAHISHMAAVMQCCRMLYQELESIGIMENMTSALSVISPLDAATSGVIHIGAHRGQEAPAYFCKVGSNVTWIECNPAIMKSLADNVAMYGHKCIEACLWNKAGEQRTLHLTSNDNQSASIVGNLTDEARQKWSFMQLAGSEASGSVKVTTTDWQSLTQMHPYLTNPSFNFLVVDAQGAEYEILEAVIQSKPYGLQQFRRLLVECSTKKFYDGQKLQVDVNTLLFNNGFDNAGVIAGDGEHSDVLYVRRDTINASFIG